MALTQKFIMQELSKTVEQYNSKNYIPVTVDLSEEGWDEVATHELLTITGLVKLTIIPEVTVEGDDTTGNTATICLGHASDSDNFIADTQVDDLAAGEVWLDATPTEVAGDLSSIISKYVNNVDVGYELKGEEPIAGTIIFHCWWQPINSSANVVASDGSAMV